MDEILAKEWYDLENSHWWHIVRYSIFLNFIKKYLGNAGAYTILDSGCGAGKMIDLLNGFGKVYGLEMSEGAIRFCKQRNINTLVQGNAGNLPFMPNSFDLIATFDGIEHLEDDHAGIRDYYEICKPGGIIVLSVPAYQFLWGEHDVVFKHYRRYTKKQLHKVVEKNGFKIERITYFNMLLLLPAIIFRCGKKILSSAKKGITHDFAFTNFPIFRPFFYNIFKIEENLLNFFDLPCGASIICVAKKV